MIGTDAGGMTNPIGSCRMEIQMAETGTTLIKIEVTTTEASTRMENQKAETETTLMITEVTTGEASTRMEIRKAETGTTQMIIEVMGWSIMIPDTTKLWVVMNTTSMTMVMKGTDNLEMIGSPDKMIRADDRSSTDRRHRTVGMENILTEQQTEPIREQTTSMISICSMNTTGIRPTIIMFVCLYFIRLTSGLQP